MPEGPFTRAELAGHELTTTLGELERTLGPFGFQWLCACATYPSLRFPLSVYLGRCLADAVHRHAPDGDEHLALFRLPWFRTGWMPEDVRLALLRHLDPKLHAVVREAIESVLFNALNQDWQDPDAAPPLNFARPPQGWRSILRGWLEQLPPGTPARDAIFVRYLVGRMAKPVGLKLSQKLARLFGAKLAGLLDRRTLLAAAAALASTALLWKFAEVMVQPLLSTTEVVTLTAPEVVAPPPDEHTSLGPESGGKGEEPIPGPAITPAEKSTSGSPGPALEPKADTPSVISPPFEKGTRSTKPAPSRKKRTPSIGSVPLQGKGTPSMASVPLQGKGTPTTGSVPLQGKGTPSTASAAPTEKGPRAGPIVLSPNQLDKLWVSPSTEDQRRQLEPQQRWSTLPPSPPGAAPGGGFVGTGPGGPGIGKSPP